MIAAPETPERGDQYGLEIWQRIRHQLPEQDARPWRALWRSLVAVDRLGLAAAAALLVVAAFVAGRVWPRVPAPAPAAPQVAGVSAPAAADVSQRILLTSIADHLDRSERVLTDIMNAPDRGDISTEQQWAEDLLTTSRLYRQDAVEAGERTVASVLDDLERSLLEIVHSPSEAGEGLTMKAAWNGVSGEGRNAVSATYRWRLTGKDSAGNQVAARTGTITIDRSRPRVRSVRISRKRLDLSRRRSTQIRFSVPEAATFRVRIRRGAFVRTFGPRKLEEAGTVVVNWNGRSAGGAKAKPGRYRVEVGVRDLAGNLTVARSTIIVVP